MTRKCSWCGEFFEVEQHKRNNAVKYCSKECRIEARRESTRKAMRKYRKTIKERERGSQLGESHLNENPSHNFKKELWLVENEIRRIGL